MRDLVKVNVLLTRAADVAPMNALYAGAFGPPPYPARTTCVVQATGRGARREVAGTTLLTEGHAHEVQRYRRGAGRHKSEKAGAYSARWSRLIVRTGP